MTMTLARTPAAAAPADLEAARYLRFAARALTGGRRPLAARWISRALARLREETEVAAPGASLPAAEDAPTYCRSCGEEFVTPPEQRAWLAARGLRPFARCAPCRAARRAVREGRR